MLLRVRESIFDQTLGQIEPVGLVDFGLSFKFGNSGFTGIPQFTLLMWGHKNKTAEGKTA